MTQVDSRHESSSSDAEHVVHPEGTHEKHPDQTAGRRENDDLVSRTELRPLRSEILANVRELVLPKLTDLLRVTVAVILLGAAMFALIEVVDAVTQLALSMSSTGPVPPFILALTIVVALCAVWIGSKVPPPGGAGALLGDSDDGVWQSSFSSRRPLLAYCALTIVLLVSWFAF